LCTKPWRLALSPQIDRELARKKAELRVTGRVKWVLMRLLGGRSPQIHDVARELGMSCRTLQRRTTAEGTTFRRLISDARREPARSYLLQPALELGEVACLLRYEDPNSFFRAFREWEGTTPGEWRRRGSLAKHDAEGLAQRARRTQR
jgi:AraC-like DNA-binding protein